MSARDRLITLITKARDTYQTETQEKLADYDALLRSAREGTVRYVVSVKSLWSDEGEIDTLGVQDDLEKAILQATVDFNRLNTRDDNQRRYSAVVMHGKTSVVLPESWYLRFIPEQNRPRLPRAG